jgi:hypothetical protein
MEIQEALYEALSRHRQDLHIDQTAHEGSLPRNGKNPATERDHELELQRTRQLEVIERCLSAVPEMAPVVNKGRRPLMSSPASPLPPPKIREQVPERPSTILEKTTPTFFAADDDEPYENPFTGLMVYPVTRNSAGPSGTQSRRHYPRDETQVRARPILRSFWPLSDPAYHSEPWKPRDSEFDNFAAVECHKLIPTNSWSSESGSEW